MLRGRRLALAMVGLLVVATAATGCRSSKVGARCAAGETGRDATHVLTCVKGRFVKGISFYDGLMLIREQQRRPLSGVWQVSSGAGSHCALINDGTVKCWGYNWGGYVSTGPTGLYDVDPRPVPGISGATAIDSFSFHTCVVAGGGSVKCWGGGRFGHPEDGISDSSPPVEIAGVTGATSIAVGWEHACAIVADGQVRCWGLNRAGQLGDGTHVDRSDAVAVSGLDGVESLALGLEHTCAVLTDHTTACWGRDDDGQLGDGGGGYHAWVDYVYGLLDGDVTSVSAGTRSSCATMSTGELRCWGVSERFGLGGTTSPSEPTVVPGVGGASRVVGGYGNHACAITAWGGSVSCWGDNQDGQLGDGTTSPSDTPVTVAGLRDVVQMDVGDDSTCAVLTDSTVKCWGDNVVGQSSNHLGKDALTPQTITELPPLP